MRHRWQANSRGLVGPGHPGPQRRSQSFPGIEGARRMPGTGEPGGLVLAVTGALRLTGDGTGWIPGRRCTDGSEASQARPGWAKWITALHPNGERWNYGPGHEETQYRRARDRREHRGQASGWARTVMGTFTPATG